jgi:hypothetical protein
MLISMRGLAVLALMLTTGTATASGSLSSRTAERALTHRLERYQGFHQANGSCRRRTAREQRCSWHGRRADGQRWHGRATVRRLKGGTIDVRITSAVRG